MSSCLFVIFTFNFCSILATEMDTDWNNIPLDLSINNMPLDLSINNMPLDLSMKHKGGIPNNTYMEINENELIDPVIKQQNIVLINDAVENNEILQKEPLIHLRNGMLIQRLMKLNGNTPIIPSPKRNENSLIGTSIKKKRAITSYHINESKKLLFVKRNEFENADEYNAPNTLFTNLTINSDAKETRGHTNSNPSDIKKDVLIITYEENDRKESNINRKDTKKIKKAIDFTTYKIPKYYFRIDIDLIKKNDNQQTLIIEASDDLSRKNLIYLFSLIFCDVESTEYKKKLIVKKEFKCLELIIPEFLPFINFIIEKERSKEVNPPAPISKENIEDFNTRLNDFLSGYYKIFDDNFVNKYLQYNTVELFLKKFRHDHRLHLFNFRSLLVDFLRMINVEEKLINCYRVLIKIYEPSTIDNVYSFNLDKELFIYFIINTETININYLEKYEKLIDILNIEKLNKEQKIRVSRTIQNGIFLGGITNLRPKYKNFLKNMNMHKFKVKQHFDGWVSFKKRNHEKKYFFYLKVGKKYKKGVSLNQIVGVFYLEFLKQLFKEQKNK